MATRQLGGTNSVCSRLLFYNRERGAARTVLDGVSPVTWLGEALLLQRCYSGVLHCPAMHPVLHKPRGHTGWARLLQHNLIPAARSPSLYKCACLEEPAALDLVTRCLENILTPSVVCRNSGLFGEERPLSISFCARLTQVPVFHFLNSSNTHKARHARDTASAAFSSVRFITCRKS